MTIQETLKGLRATPTKNERFQQLNRFKEEEFKKLGIAWKMYENSEYYYFLMNIPVDWKQLPASAIDFEEVKSLVCIERNLSGFSLLLRLENRNSFFTRAFDRRN